MKREKWTKSDIPDLSGKIIIVTGGNSGLGFESVKAFAEKGAEVIMASRSVKKGEAAKSRAGGVKGTIVVMKLDLQDFDSIDRFADTFRKQYDRLDILMNNAGIMTTPYFKTKDGLEAQSGINHYGHFKLTGLLLPLLISTSGSRVVNVSSLAHKSGNMNFDDLHFENGGYTPMKSYGRSKLANLLFTYQLQRLFEQHGADTISVAAHPGVAMTNLGRYHETKYIYKLIYPLARRILPGPESGSLPQIRAAVDPDVQGGQYYGPHFGLFGYPVLVKSNGLSKNVEDAKRLWNISEEITGVKFFS
jgi:NAD(P)-dependent dehydrogenase (short-subunit alcohol dehydrogenase family)